MAPSVTGSEKVEVQTDMEHTNENTFIVPNYTIKQLLDAIPSDCYERSAIRSSLFIVQDVAFIASFVYASTWFPDVVKAAEAAGLPFLGAKVLNFALWNAFWFWTGLAGTGLWIVGHECGHQAFSPSRTINNAVGWVIHSALGVPYHSWRISHGRHHAATGHVTRDEVFVPRTREQLGIPTLDETKEDVEGVNVAEERQHELREAIGDAPLYVLGNLLAQQLFGWPMYLIRNASGQKHYPAFTNHFNPDSVIFDKRHRNQIVASDIGIAILFTVLGTWGYTRGFKEVAAYYLVPYLWVNHWLVSITFLQHTDPLVPHYNNATWTFSRGALTTVDRECLGWVGRVFLHGITDWHVAHHIKSSIPHYHGKRATDSLKAMLGDTYQYRSTWFLADLFRNYRDCVFIENHKEDVIFYKNRSGVAQMVGVVKGGNISDSGIDVSEKTTAGEKTK